MSDSIERAAERIWNAIVDPQNPLFRGALEQIIRDELFREVKAENVDSTRQYYVMGHRGWFICDGRSIGPEDEIRGPVPFPE